MQTEDSVSTQSMIIRSEDELVNAFRPRDRKHVEIPRYMRFPVAIEHYLAWTEPSGVRIFLLFRKPGTETPIGVAFRRDQQGSAFSPKGVCDWCLHQGPSDEVGLLTATVNSKRRVGVYLCLDLSCLEKLQSVAELTGQDFNALAKRLQARMARFCDEGLTLST